MYSDDFEEEHSSTYMASTMSNDKFIECFICHVKIRAAESNAHIKACRARRMSNVSRTHDSSVSYDESIGESIEIS